MYRSFQINFEGNYYDFYKYTSCIFLKCLNNADLSIPYFSDVLTIMAMAFDIKILRV